MNGSLLELDALTAISPIDGRYAGKCAELREVFSEFGLVKRRVLVECAWLEALCDAKEIRECKSLTAAERKALRAIASGFSVEAQRDDLAPRAGNGGDDDVALRKFPAREGRVGGALISGGEGKTHARLCRDRGHGEHLVAAVDVQELGDRAQLVSIPGPCRKRAAG